MKPWLDRLRRAALAEGGLPLVWLLLTVMVLIPVWHQRLLPMLDSPNHLALIRGWASFHDPAYRISEFYDLRLRAVPYLLHFGFVRIAMVLFKIEVANKLFLSLYLILFPLSVLSVARALKRSPWLALGAFALAFNQNWIYGFMSYLMGGCFLFFGVALLIRYLDEGGAWRAGLIGLCALATYFGHVLSFFCLGVLAIAICVKRLSAWRRVVTACAAMLPSLTLAVLTVKQETPNSPFMNRPGEFKGSWHDFPKSVIEFPRRVLEIFPGNVDYAVLAVLALSTVALLVWQRRASREPRTGDGSALLELILVMLGLLYLSVPFEITAPFWWWYVSARIPALIAPMLLLWPSVRIEGRARLLMIPVVAACVVLPLKLSRLYGDFSRRNAGFMRLVEQIPLGAPSLVAFRGMSTRPGSQEASGDPASSGPVYWHYSSWPMALRGGYSPHAFNVGFPIAPKKTLAAPAWDEQDTFTLRGAPEFEYYLVHDAPDDMDREPALKRVDELGEWKLFHREHALTEEP